MTVLLLWALAAAPAPDPAEASLISRIQTIGVKSSERLAPPARLAPGDPPLLRFRYLDGKRRHRFGDLGLVMDDAGH
jgi:hypothetical protein